MPDENSQFDHHAPRQPREPAASTDIGPLRTAARWWEPRRLWYNAVLFAVVGALFARTWRRLAPELSPGNIVRLLVLVLIFNLFYSAAYPADVALQTVRAPSHRHAARWAVWITGTVFAMLLETYWYLDEILPPPR